MLTQQGDPIIERYDILCFCVPRVCMCQHVCGCLCVPSRKPTVGVTLSGLGASVRYMGIQVPWS